MSRPSEIALPSSLTRKNSHSTPVRSSKPRFSAASIWRFRTMRGDASTSTPFIQRSAGSHATSGRQGSRMRLSASGMANMSGSAGVMSSHAAKPAKPAPSRCMSPIARAGTSLERRVPKRSAKQMRKYRIPSCFATWARSVVMIAASEFPVVRSVRGGSPVRARAARRRGRILSSRPRYLERPGIQSVPASGTWAIAAASTVTAARSSGSRLSTWLLPQARARVWSSRVIVVR